MSQTQEETLTKADDHDIDEAASEENDEEMEDGEIDDSDEEASSKPSEVTAESTVSPAPATHESSQQASPQQQKPSSNATKETPETIAILDLTGHDVATIQQPQPAAKSKKPQPVDDDFATNIEQAIANALKKKGIEPTMPKILDAKQNNENSDESGAAPGQGQSKSSRRRKRKRQREEKEKEKEKRKRKDTPDALGPPAFGDEMDMDEFEMMNVRGGSPPPVAARPPPPLPLYDDYDSRDDSASSYDSYDSNDEGSNGERRRRRHKKESRRRKEKRAERHEKRSRRDSLDEKHRNEPRKLELCKFYLMECCAKRDKCSYMHAEFPCKYHYLGMDCPTKDDCKFSHGEPLSEELRNILLKHLETAPKEILGNFKRMSRENALSMVTKRHEELCRKYNVQNVWAPITASALPIPHSRRNNHNNNSNNNSNNNKHDHQQNSNNSNIPSLLDLVVNPPQNIADANKANANENKRKSRWADNSNSGGNKASNASNSVIQPPSKSAPSYLDLKNLTGILSSEHIDKLSQMGIVNLEQVNQLTFGQLNQIGLTIAEITEIQLNAINMAKLGVTGGPAGTSASLSALKQSLAKSKENALAKDMGKSSNGDVDMRLLPNITPSSSATTTSASTLDVPEKDNTNSSNSNSSSGVVMVDYSQYLKDSNISFDRSDIYDDEKDDEQLVIDDDNLEEQPPPPPKPYSHDLMSQQATEEKSNTGSYDNSFATKVQSNVMDIVKNFRNPFKAASGFYDTESKPAESRDSRSAVKHSKLPNNDYEDSYNSPSMYSRKRKDSRDSRSRSRTPPSSTTPEPSQSPTPMEETSTKLVVYERPTIYDFNSANLAEDDNRASKQKADKDMRFLPGSLMGESSSSDIDLRLPFQPMTSYTPATEIDGSITSHLPINYKVYLVDVPRASYSELKQHFKSEQATDPRLRRILGLADLSPSKTSTALSRKVRKSSSNSIASPSETEDASPRYYTPSASEDKKRSSTRADPRGGDPRVSDPRQDPRSDPRRADPRASATAATSSSTSTSSPNSAVSNPAGGQKQNIEIRNLLQKSDWYKNLNSKFKIMVNQQLALVSTELKKFHQDTSPNKIFDISFIVNNQTLQQILTNLGIFIDDTGEVEHLDGDEQNETATQDMPGKSKITLPNLSQPPPNAAANQINPNNPPLDFLRAPPPNMVPQGPPPMALGPMFQRPPMQVSPFTRPSLLGLPPGQNNPMNPFNNPLNNLNINPNFLAAGPGLLAAFGGPGGPNFAAMQMQQQRNFNNQRNNNNRNQNKRRI